MSLPTFPETSKYQWSCDDLKLQFPIHNPATGKVITTVQAGNAATTEQAIEVAQHAFQSDWRYKSPAERSQLLFKCADAVEKHSEELAMMLCMENGKPYQDALAFDLKFLPSVFRYFASLIDKLPNQFFDRGNVNVTVVREPHGVVAGILPFNWPPIHTGGKAAPALAAGNTIILKPGEQAPLTCLRIVEILQEVLPPGVVQAVPGVGPEVPQALLNSPIVKFVSFTGSTPAGIAVSKTAANTMKPMALELGGKNCIIVFDDANLDNAIKAAIDGGFFNKGEACTASSRLIVQSGIHDEFVKRLSAAVKRLKAGNGMDKATHVGPAVSEVQQKKVLDWIETGKKEGAIVAAQAPLPLAPQCKNGFFIPPTLFTGVKRSMEIAKEEIFGPVVTVTSFDTEQEAIDIANEPRYGLVACVYSRDSEQQWRVSRRLEAGVVYVNNYMRNILGTPFGGVKDSGHGREHTIETLHEWTTTKLIQTPSGLSDIPYWRGANDVTSGSVNGI